MRHLDLWGPWLAMAALAVLGASAFPGSHYLYQDTQIWLPVIEHLENPEIFSEELIVSGAHVRLTLVDEVVIGLRRLSGLPFADVLRALQLLFRFVAMAGVFLIARGFELTPSRALIAAGLHHMGATVVGPAVLAIEYEPVPRGFAFPLALLSLGLIGQGRHRWAAAALGLAFVIHAPTIWPLLLMLGIRYYTGGAEERARRRDGGLILAAFVAVLLFTAWIAPAGPMNPFFARLSPEHEQLQRLRASYNWISLWYARFAWQYAVLAALAAWAWRPWLKRGAGKERNPVAALLAGTAAIGILTMPLSYLLLEQMKWALVPQIQPMRALLFTLAAALIGCAIRGLKSGNPLWLLAPGIVPLLGEWKLASPTAIAVGAGVALAAAGAARVPWLTPVALAVMLWLPPAAGIRNYRQLETPELVALAGWAKSKTPQSAVFLFADNGRTNEPGWFRASALRTVYVDWKGGGQVNFYEFYARAWWERWQATMTKPVSAASLDEFRKRGVTYLVLTRKHPDLGLPVLFQNARYTVYPL